MVECVHLCMLIRDIFAVGVVRVQMEVVMVVVVVLLPVVLIFPDEPRNISFFFRCR